MAQQKAFGQDDKGKLKPSDGFATAQAGGTGARPASFVGGDIDPVSGNLVPGGKVQAAGGQTITGSENPPPPPPPPPPPAPEASQVAAPPPRMDQVFAEPAPAPVAAAPAPAPAPREDKSNVVEYVSSWFCYAAGTAIIMEDGSKRAVETLALGDRVMLGGEVVGRGEVRCSDIREYLGTEVSATHAVLEGDRFIRVGSSALNRPAIVPTGVVYPIVTENHLLMTATHIAADFTEVEGSESMNHEQRLEALNADRDVCERLARTAAGYYGAPK